MCCADGNHCCPENYKCNEDKTTCVRGEVEIPWYTKLPAITSVQVDPNNVQCDNDHQCPERTSCCKLFTGEWGCCPLQNVRLPADSKIFYYYLYMFFLALRPPAASSLKNSFIFLRILRIVKLYYYYFFNVSRIAEAECSRVC